MESIGPYRILERLGGGGETRLYACEEDIAVKVFAPSERKRKRALRRGRPDPAPAALQAFNRESALLDGISGPGLIPLVDRGMAADDRPYFSMPLYGGTVATRMWHDRYPRKSVDPLPAEEALVILSDILTGAQTLRSHGVIHRDLKPQNILLSADGRAVICDLGQALSRNHAEPVPIRNPGTYPYVAPELRNDEVDGKADLYAVGMVAHLMFAGYLPGDGPAIRQGNTPEHVVDWIEAALDRIPANRPDSLPDT